MSPRPFEAPAPTGEPRLDALAKLVAIVDRLRAPDGCPWDLDQTLESIAPHHIEEAHELVEAIESGDDRHTAEEAGDLLMGVVLLARVAEQAGRFDLAQVGEAVCAKLLRRHPHVFGEVGVDSADQALSNWNAIKRAEREAKGEHEDSSAISGVPAALPALQRAGRLSAKAIAAGFKWADARGALAKVREELDELEAAFDEAEASTDDGAEAARARLEDELGDVLMAAAFLGNYVRLEPERALRRALRRFERRFRAMESALERPFEDCDLPELIAAWEAAKASLRDVENGART